MAVEFTEAVVDERGHAAHEPAGGVTHGDGDDLVGDIVGHDVEVYLAEDHEGAQHDPHGHLAVARAAEGGGVDLVDAEEEIEG